MSSGLFHQTFLLLFQSSLSLSLSLVLPLLTSVSNKASGTFIAFRPARSWEQTGCRRVTWFTAMGNWSLFTAGSLRIIFQLPVILPKSYFLLHIVSIITRLSSSLFSLSPPPCVLLREFALCAPCCSSSPLGCVRLLVSSCILSGGFAMHWSAEWIPNVTAIKQTSMAADFKLFLFWRNKWSLHREEQSSDLIRNQ